MVLPLDWNKRSVQEIWDEQALWKKVRQQPNKEIRRADARLALQLKAEGWSPDRILKRLEKV